MNSLEDPAPPKSPKPLQDMAKVGRAVAALRRQTHHPGSINTTPQRGFDDSLMSVGGTPRLPGRRGSRASNRVPPQIVVESPQPDEALYPSLTTLASLDQEEDDFSCKDCCKSGMCVWLYRTSLFRVCVQWNLSLQDVCNTYRLDDESEVYTGNQKPEGRMSASRAHSSVLSIYVYGGIVLVRMSVSVKLEHSYSNGGEGSVLSSVPISEAVRNGCTEHCEDQWPSVYILSLR